MLYQKSFQNCFAESVQQLRKFLPFKPQHKKSSNFLEILFNMYNISVETVFKNSTSKYFKYAHKSNTVLQFPESGTLNSKT